MSTDKIYTEKLTDAQTSALLSAAFEDSMRGREYLEEFERLKSLPGDALSKTVMEVLRSAQLHRSKASARLLGMSELTVRRWFGSLKPFPESVREKLAGLCLLLPMAHDGACPHDAKILIRAAISALKMESGDHGPLLRDDAADTVAAVFDVAGLMAAAMHLLLRSEDNGESQDD